MRFFRIPAFTGIETHRDDADRGSLRVVEGCVPHGPGGLRSGPVWEKVGDVDLFSDSDNSQSHMTGSDDGEGNSVVYVSRAGDVHDMAVFSTENTDIVSLGSTYAVAAPTLYNQEAAITPIGNRLYAMGDGSAEAAYIGKGPPTATAAIFPDEVLYDQEWSRFPSCKFYVQGPKKTIFAAGNPDKPLTVYISEPAGLTNPYRDSPHSTELTNHNAGVLSTVDILSSNASVITALSTRGDQVVVHTDKGCHLLYAPQADQASTGYRTEQTPATNFSGAVNVQVVAGESGTQPFWLGHDGQIYKDEAASRGAEDFKSQSDPRQASWKAKGQWEKELPVDLSGSFATYDPLSGMYWIYVESDEYKDFIKDDMPNAPFHLRAVAEPVLVPINLVAEADAVLAPINLNAEAEQVLAPINLNAKSPVIAPINLNAIADAVLAPINLNAEAESVLAPINLNAEAEQVLAPINLNAVADAVLPPINLNAVGEPVLAPINLNAEAEHVLAPINLKAAAEVLTPINLNATAEQVLAPINLNATADAVLAPINLNATPEPVLAPINLIAEKTCCAAQSDWETLIKFELFTRPLRAFGTDMKTTRNGKTYWANIRGEFHFTPVDNGNGCFNTATSFKNDDIPSQSGGFGWATDGTGAANGWWSFEDPEPTCTLDEDCNPLYDFTNYVTNHITKDTSGELVTLDYVFRWGPDLEYTPYDPVNLTATADAVEKPINLNAEPELFSAYRNDTNSNPDSMWFLMSSYSLQTGLNQHTGSYMYFKDGLTAAGAASDIPTSQSELDGAPWSNFLSSNRLDNPIGAFWPTVSSTSDFIGPVKYEESTTSTGNATVKDRYLYWVKMSWGGLRDWSDFGLHGLGGQTYQWAQSINGTFPSWYVKCKTSSTGNNNTKYFWLIADSNGQYRMRAHSGKDIGINYVANSITGQPQLGIVANQSHFLGSSGAFSSSNAFGKHSLTLFNDPYNAWITPTPSTNLTNPNDQVAYVNSSGSTITNTFRVRDTS